MDPQLLEYETMVDNHRLLKLKELVDWYNQLPTQEDYFPDEYQSPHQITHRPDYHPIKVETDTPEEYILRLWRCCVEIPNVLTFGEPYDGSIKKYLLIEHFGCDYSYLRVFREPQPLLAYIFLRIDFKPLKKKSDLVNTILKNLNYSQVNWPGVGSYLYYHRCFMDIIRPQGVGIHLIALLMELSVQFGIDFLDEYPEFCDLLLH